MAIFIDNNLPSSSSTVTIPEYTSDPVSPSAGDTWVLKTQLLASGNPIGLLLALTYANDIFRYQLSYYTTEATIIRTVLN